ncbi:MAG: 16S rRNA (guanine(966)-N(2))-methyltransferase RsmD [Solirubrobacterales bacterium]
MRIVAGSHRGRRLAAPPGRVARPTADRTREAVFNILAHSAEVELDGAVVVDCFAGSGALGLEALSRGAAHAYFIEQNAQSLAALKANIEALGEDARARAFRADAARPPPAPGRCTLAFLDAPYHSDLSGPCLEALARAGWLAAGALAVVEVAADEDFAAPEGFEAVDERRYGAAKVIFAVYRG